MGSPGINSHKGNIIQNLISFIKNLCIQKQIPLSKLLEHKIILLIIIIQLATKEICKFKGYIRHIFTILFFASLLKLRSFSNQPMYDHINSGFRLF